MSDEKKFNVAINFEVTNADGSPFSNAGFNYSNCGYENVLAIENACLSAINNLQALAAKK